MTQIQFDALDTTDPCALAEVDRSTSIDELAPNAAYYIVTWRNGLISQRLDATNEREARAEFDGLGPEHIRCAIDGGECDIEDDIGVDLSHLSRYVLPRMQETRGAVGAALVASSDDLELWAIDGATTLTERVMRSAHPDEACNFIVPEERREQDWEHEATVYDLGGSKIRISGTEAQIVE